MQEEPVVTEPVTSEPAPDTDVLAPDSAPETEDVPNDAVEDAPSPDDTADGDETLEDEPLVTELVDEEPLTPERIGKLRIPQSEKDVLLKVHTQLHEKTELLDSFGTEFEIDALKPFAKLLRQSDATPEEIDTAFSRFAQSNETVAKRFVDGITYGVMNTPEYIEPVFKQVFGDNATISNVKKLLAFDKAGLIDHESGMDYMRMDEDIISLHAQEVQALKDQLEEARNPQVTQAQSNAAADFDADFHKIPPAALDPYFSQVNWKGADTLTGLVVEVLQARLKNSAQYTETQKYLNETGRYRNGADVVPMANANLALLKNLSTAQGKELIRKVQADIKKISLNSRNAVQEAKRQEADTPKVDTAPPINMPNETPEQRMARLDAKFKGRILQSQ